MKLAALLGKFVLMVATVALLMGVSLFLVGASLTTWPLMRLSARGRKTQAMVGMAVALMALGRAFQPDEVEPEPEPEP